MLRWMDSFDLVTTAPEDRYEAFVRGASITTDASGRHGTRRLLLNNATVSGPDPNYLEKWLDNQQTWIIGFAWQPVGAATELCALYDGTAHQINLHWDSGAAVLVVYRSGIELARGSVPLSGGWHYIEWKTTIANSGTTEVRVDGATHLSFTGDTQTTANAFAQRIRLGSALTPVDALISMDDLYICDGQGTENNDFLGDVRVAALLPNGNGNYSQWDGSDGNSVDNYQLVDDTPHNSDTDYVSTGVVDERDSYALPSLPSVPAAVHGVMASMFAKKDDTADRTVALTVRTGGVDDDGAAHTMTSSYEDYIEIWEENPDGAVAWTEAAVNAAEVGVKVVS